MNIVRIEKEQARPDPALTPHIEGEAQFQHLFHAESGNGHEIVMAHFSPGARTLPHFHKQGQILYITEGKGIVATEKEERVVTAGDVVVTAPGIWHWHGATREAAMSHLAIQGPVGDLIWNVEMKNWANGYDTP